MYTSNPVITRQTANWDVSQGIMFVYKSIMISTLQVPGAYISGGLCQKHVSRAGTINYITQIHRYLFFALDTWYLLLAQHSTYIVGTHAIHIVPVDVLPPTCAGPSAGTAQPAMLDIVLETIRWILIRKHHCLTEKCGSNCANVF